MKRLISFGFSLTAFVLGTYPLAQAQVGLSWEVQAPELTAPSRGSLAGQLSAIAFGPADVSRGGFNLASPYTAPVDRGPLLAKVFPGYSPETGISEWGLGWQADLALTRWRVRGDLDYQTDDLTGMFGHCQKPQKGDGYWYPVGLTPALRLQEVPDGFVAYAPDGTIFRFGQSARVITPSGTYQWLLREVENVIGQKTKLTYGEVNASGRLFLTRVEYGGRGEDFQYRIDISYSPLAQDFVDYRSHFPLHLDRRVNAVAVYAKSTATGQMALRWKYQPTYQPEPLGPAFFLSAVQQVFASGETPPAFTFQYQLATSILQGAQLQPASKFEGVIADFTSGIPFPDRSTAFDAGMNGMVDLESAFDYTLIRQTADGYLYEALPDPSGGERAECRAAPSNANRPRTLAQIRPSDRDYSVVSLQYRQSTLDTELLLCGREGLARFDTAFSGDWTLSPTLRLVDLNRDHQPDLIRVYEGGYQVIPNASTSDAYAFSAPIQGILDLHFPFEGFWVLDFNGDGIPDLVLRSDSLIAVYFGKGNFQFEPEPQFFPVENEVGQQFDLSNFQFTWLDANGDGLTDLLLSLPTGAYLFSNTGSSLRQTPVPALSAADNISFPLFSDFVGSGNAEVFVLRANKPYSLALNAPGTSLLQSANDGRGTVLRFSYLRSPAVEGIHQRHSLLDTLTVETSGHDSVTYRYNYDAPVLHSIGQFLLGFGHVTRQGAALTETMDFFNNDTTTGLLLASNQHDDNSPQVDAFETRQYEDVNSFGVSWKRLRTLRSGWKKPGSGEMISEQTDYPQYEAEVCPRLAVSNNANGTLVTEKTRASVSNLEQHLHCLESQIILRGVHANKTYDFVYENHFDRNPVGLITRVQSLAGTDALTLQEVTYNADYTIDHISAPGRGSTGFAYDIGTHLLKQVTTPDQTVAQAVDRDPVTDSIRSLRTDRGALSFTQYFRYDGQERLAKSWNDLGGATEQTPNKTFSYRYATATTPASAKISNLADAASGITSDSVEFATAAGESFTTARHIPEGWVFDSLIERNISRRESKSHLRPTTTPDVDILGLTYPAFFGSAQQISSSRMSSFGHEVESRLKFHADVEKQVSASLDLAKADLTQTELENGTFRTVRHLDAGKRVLAFEDEAGTRYSYLRDAMGRLRDVVLPDGKHHRVTFDGYGRVGRYDRDGVASVSYTYDGTTGLMTQKLFLSASGQPMRQVAFAYDAIGRKSLDTHTDLTTSASQSFHYYYDGSTPENPAAQTSRGLLTAVSGDGFVKRFLFRADGSLSRRNVSIVGWRGVETQFSYYEDGTEKERGTTLLDNLGQPLSRTVQHYDRDAYGRPSAISLDGRALTTLTYDNNGQLVQANLASGDSVQLNHDSLTRRLMGMSESTSHWTASNSQRMNNWGFVGSEIISLNALTLNRVYGYSPPGFLTSSTDEQTSYSYEFDSFGLPTSITKNADSRTLVDSGNTLTVANAAGSVVYRFDWLGRTVQKGDLSFAYGPSGRVVQAQRGADSWSFVYDEGGQRLGKQSSDGFVAGYFDEGYVDSAGLTQCFQLAGTTVGVVQSGALQLFPIDMRGTVTGETDGTARFPSPFGDRAVHPGISAAIDYVRKGFDADLGIIQMGVRDYDPNISRFLTPDPLLLEDPERCLKSPVECNLYGYARSSPATFVDPTGHESETNDDRTTSGSAGSDKTTAESPSESVFGRFLDRFRDFGIKLGFKLGPVKAGVDGGGKKFVAVSKGPVSASLNEDAKVTASIGVDQGLTLGKAGEVKGKVEAKTEIAPMEASRPGYLAGLKIEVDASVEATTKLGPGKGFFQAKWELFKAAFDLGVRSSDDIAEHNRRLEQALRNADKPE